MKKTIIILFYINLICWFAFITLYVILRISLFKTLFNISNVLTIFFGSWISGYYFKVYEPYCHKIKRHKHSKKVEDHTLDILKYYEMLPKNEQQKHDEIAQFVNSHTIYTNRKSVSVHKKCVNCKHFVWIVNHKIGDKKPGAEPLCCLKLFDPNKIYQFNKCKDFEEK